MRGGCVFGKGSQWHTVSAFLCGKVEDRALLERADAMRERVAPVAADGSWESFHRAHCGEGEES